MNRDDIIRMAREAGFHNWYSDPSREYHFGCVMKFANMVASEEREECAKVCDGRKQEGLSMDGCATSIRARRNA